jgi:hypothetical protein
MKAGEFYPFHFHLLNAIAWLPLIRPSATFSRKGRREKLAALRAGVWVLDYAAARFIQATKPRDASTIHESLQNFM